MKFFNVRASLKLIWRVNARSMRSRDNVTLQDGVNRVDDAISRWDVVCYYFGAVNCDPTWNFKYINVRDYINYDAFGFAENPYPVGRKEDLKS